MKAKLPAGKTIGIAYNKGNYRLLMKAILQQWERRYSMWNLKTIMLFVVLWWLVAISISIANNAEEQKTYTLTEVKTVNGEYTANVGNFLTNEVEKTKEYQKKSWEEMKTQTSSKTGHN